MVGGAAGPEYLPLSYGKKIWSLQWATNRFIFKRQSFPTFFVISRISSKNETFHGVSPFLVEKAITGSVDDVKATKKLRSGDLLVEVESPKQAKEISKLKSLSTIPVTVKPHATLNSSKGVISCGELLNVSEEKIIEELKSQGVIHVRRITIRRDGQLLNTKHLISVPIPRTPPAITNLSNPSFPSVAPLCENTSASPDLTDFKLVTKRKKLKKDSPSKTHSISTAEKISKFYTTSSPKVTNPIPTKDNISSHKSTFKPLETTKPTTVDIELLPMAVLPPLEKRILQSRESDADAERRMPWSTTCRRTWKTHLQLSVLHPLPNLKRQTNIKTGSIIASVLHIVCF
ncbi:hypothetical protein AVEN_21761-1 [Araneus ventricosus]|uniref:Uncharacterized protein n=1 Tax=Araneus ventricosus TaxID=182803 RepID=A0A4Y2NQE1_ARAVE|nr:hypothetical protein AVEN_21761-1 [Araneus ventricosus]